MKWLLAIASFFSGVVRLLNRWFDKKEKEQKKDEANFKKLEQAVKTDKPVRDVQSAVDDYRSRL